MSESEAEKLIRRFVEHKMMWHSEEGFEDRYAINQALNILGEDKVKKITAEVRELWND